jgi:hypothetical protein
LARALKRRKMVCHVSALFLLRKFSEVDRNLILLGFERFGQRRGGQRWDNLIVKNVSTPKPHPGPFRLVSIGVGAVGIIIALSFVTLGLIGLPLAKFFLLGAILLGVGIAILLHAFRKKPMFPKRYF